MSPLRSALLTQSLTVDSIRPPAPVLTQAPANPSGSSATVAFTDGDATAGFSCSLDGQAAVSCPGNMTYSGLGEGSTSSQ